MKLRQGKDGQKEAPESGVKAVHISLPPGTPYFRVLGGVCVGHLAMKQAGYPGKLTGVRCHNVLGQRYFYESTCSVS